MRAPEPPTRDRSAFAWTFGVCTVLPLAGALLMLLGGAFASSLSNIGIVALFAAPVVWLFLLVAGLVARLSGQPARGNGVMLGALAGAVVGFSLCSGVLMVADSVL